MRDPLHTSGYHPPLGSPSRRLGRIAMGETARVRRLDPRAGNNVQAQDSMGNVTKGSGEAAPAVDETATFEQDRQPGQVLVSNPIGSPSGASHSAAAGPALGGSARSRTKRAASHCRRLHARHPAAVRWRRPRDARLYPPSFGMRPAMEAVRVRRVALPPRRRVVPAGLMGGPFNFKGFPPSGERNSAELAVF
jgi:hypothetical protein